MKAVGALSKCSVVASDVLQGEKKYYIDKRDKCASIIEYLQLT